MKFIIETEGIEKLLTTLEDLEKKQLPFATAKALNKTAEDIKDAEVKQMQSSFDRPTAYTLNSLYIKYANKQNLSAMVGFKDKSQAGKGNASTNFIYPQVKGGRRHLKRFESALRNIGVLPQGMYIVPGAACPLDAYGNIPAGLIVQILSYFRAFGEQGYRANITDKRKAALAKGSKRKGTMGFKYFVSAGKSTWFGPHKQHLPAGIYKRTGFVSGSAIKPIMMFVSNPSYSERFPFYTTAQNVIDNKLKSNFKEAMEEAIRTAK